MEYVASQLVPTFRAIVSREFPASLETFDIEGEAAIADALDGKEQEPALDRDAHAGFGGLADLPISTVSDILKLITGTVTLLQMLKSYFANRSPAVTLNTAEIQSRWYEQLCKSGLDEASAKRVSLEFAGELNNLLTSKQ